jgi:hypothetical protein
MEYTVTIAAELRARRLPPIFRDLFSGGGSGFFTGGSGGNGGLPLDGEYTAELRRTFAGSARKVGRLFTLNLPLESIG